MGRQQDCLPYVRSNGSRKCPKSRNLEEIQRDMCKGHDVWSVTLSVPRDIEQLPAMVRLSADPIQYKRFLIDSELSNGHVNTQEKTLTYC